MKKKIFTLLSRALFLTVASVPIANAGLLGPSEYLEYADSPFYGGSFDYFHLEDFEDNALNTLGVTASAGYVTTSSFSGSIIDSVDGDDDTIDGTCSNCDSWYVNGATGVTFTFNAGVLGGLPTSAGIVWTDASTANSAYFEAFDINGASLGSLTGTHQDGNYNGGTAEDRFYGVEHSAGISSIFIKHPGGGLEVDHLQYGKATGGTQVPEPATLALMGFGLAGIGCRRKKLKPTQ